MILFKSKFKTYICNPVKNNKCKKTNCYKNGGPCHRTIDKEFEIKIVNKNNK